MFSAPMDWSSMVDQLRKLEKDELHISLPVVGEVLAARVRIVIASGLVDLNALIKQATVRRNIVVELIKMHRDAKHPDYNLELRKVEERAKQLAPTDEPAIPNGLAEFFTTEEGEEVPLPLILPPFHNPFLLAAPLGYSPQPQLLPTSCRK